MYNNDYSHFYPTLNQFAFSSSHVKPQSGCICPVGANKECENPHCPRKPQKPPTPMGIDGIPAETKPGQ